MKAHQETSPEELRVEAAALGWMILRREVDPEFLERYVQAHEFLFTGALPQRETATVAWAVRRRRVLPCLDAAAALTEPDSLFHRKAILMSAILEASPRYVEEFLPRRCGWMGLVVLGARIGLTTVVSLVVGLPAWWIVRSRA